MDGREFGEHFRPPKHSPVSMGPDSQEELRTRLRRGSGNKEEAAEGNNKQ